jgi:hypothetical protein
VSASGTIIHMNRMITEGASKGVVLTSRRLRRRLPADGTGATVACAGAGWAMAGSLKSGSRRQAGGARQIFAARPRHGRYLG